MAEYAQKWHHLRGVHALVCPIRSRWLRRRNHQPFWRDDRTAQMLGVAHVGCPRCGRDAAATTANTTHRGEQGAETNEES